MREDELLSLLRAKFKEPRIQEGLKLADAGVRLTKDHTMVDAGKGKFKDVGIASIYRTESKVELDLASLSPRCLSCGLSRGAVCRHNISLVIAANRQGFLPDEDIHKLVGGLYETKDKGAELATRVCPSCRRPLEVTSQVVCPNCGRAVCPDCYRNQDRMCARCYDVKVLGKRFMPAGVKAGAKDVLRPLAKPAFVMLIAYGFMWLMFYSRPLRDVHPLLPIALIVVLVVVPIPIWAYLSWRRKARSR